MATMLTQSSDRRILIPGYPSIRPPARPLVDIRYDSSRYFAR
jgi:hypothetical protein